MSMAKLTKDDVVHVAKLAKLELSKKEIEKFQKQLTKVVDYIDELSEVDTTNVKPTSQTTGLANVAREDEVNSGYILGARRATSGSEKVKNNYFVVSAVISKDD